MVGGAPKLLIVRSGHMAKQVSETTSHGPSRRHFHRNERDGCNRPLIRRLSIKCEKLFASSISKTEVPWNELRDSIIKVVAEDIFGLP